MGTQTVAVFLLVALVGGSQADGVQEVISFIKSMVEPVVDCKFGELSCSTDCEKVRVCLGGGLYGEVEDCKGASPESLCDPATVTCKEELTVCPIPNPKKLICVDKKGGLFPNPYDCHSYFECAEQSTAKSHTIPREIVQVDSTDCTPNPKNGYDPATEMCIFPSTHRVCKEGPIPTCVESMQSGALIENPNMYFVCANISGILQPFLARCDKDTQIFQDRKCVEDDASTTEQTTTDAVTTTSPGVTTTSPGETTSPGVTTTSPGVTTTSPGVTTTSPGVTTTSPEVTTTSPGVTTTSPGVTTTSPGVTTTSPEVTTTSPGVTTTLPTSTTSKYYCTTPGTTIPDPLNCRAYYLCTMDMQQIHFVCQQGYHYDKILGRCVKGTC